MKGGEEEGEEQFAFLASLASSALPLRLQLDVEHGYGRQPQFSA